MPRSNTLLSLVCFAFLAAFLLHPTNANAQKRKSNSKNASTASKPKGKASDAKKGSKSAKNDKKSNKRDSDRDSAKNRRDKRDDKRSAKEDSRRDRNSRDKKDKRDRDERDDRNARNSKDKRKMTAAEKREARREDGERKRQARIEAARREAERRAAIEAERRRRAEIERRRREAIARQRAFENGLKTETQANIAADDTTGEDLEIRQAAIRALGSKAGTVVVMDAQNGQIITAVNQKWAYGQGYKPCSTIKLVTGAAGVNEGVITQQGNVSHKNTRLDLTDSLAYSNNGYFQVVGGEVGFNKMSSYAREFGLGQTTGVNVQGESTGRIPDPKSGWALNRMSSHGDDFQVTPIQLATMVSSITNGGKVLQPQVARTAKEKENLRAKVRRELNVSRSTLQTLVPGMIGAVNYGTAKRAFDPTLNIGGKTGSCIGQGSWLGLFASVAPVANPKYAVVVITRGSAERGKWASAVAGQVYQALAPKIRALQPLIAKTPQPVTPRPKVDANTAASLSDEEETDEAEREEAEIIAGGNKNTTLKQGDALNENKSRLVKPTVASRPVGQPAGQTPTTKKGEYKPFTQPSPVPQTTPTVKVRPRIVPQ